MGATPSRPTPGLGSISSPPRCQKMYKRVSRPVPALVLAGMCIRASIGRRTSGRRNAPLSVKPRPALFGAIIDPRISVFLHRRSSTRHSAFSWNRRVSDSARAATAERVEPSAPTYRVRHSSQTVLMVLFPRGEHVLSSLLSFAARLLGIARWGGGVACSSKGFLDGGIKRPESVGVRSRFVRPVSAQRQTEKVPNDPKGTF